MIHAQHRSYICGYVIECSWCLPSNLVKLDELGKMYKNKAVEITLGGSLGVSVSARV